ncbi:MAG: DUF4131 domain-containing protein [Lewinellaceae bacterium]|nr:DUF4131 domain-containing protein [Lewinellaceae bacterium]
MLWRQPPRTTSAFLPGTPQSETLRYGDRVAVRASIRLAESSRKPAHAFDYGRYLHFQNIHFQSFVKTDSLVLLSRGHGNFVWRAAFGCRKNCFALLHGTFRPRMNTPLHRPTADQV